ncbi:MAG: ABC transporter ATP-binding protein [Nitrospinae bacterium]|nr:ABC transporter ATP-binding protein [Nitrospinota bacterium]
MFVKTIKSFLPYLKVYRTEIGIGIAALLVTDLAGLVIPWLLKQFIDLLPKNPSSALLAKYAGFLFLAALVQAVSRYGWRKYLFGPSRKIEFDILNRMFRCLQSLDRAWFLKQKVGDLMSRGANDLRAVKDFIGLGLLIMIDSAFVIVACVALMLYLNPLLTFYSLLPLPFLSILFFKFVKTIGKRHLAIQEHLGKITATVQENLAGIRVLHAFVQEEHQKKKFDELNRDYIEKNMRLTKIFGMFTPSLVFTVGVASMISLWVGGKMVISGDFTLGSFVAFNGYLLMLSWPMMGIGYVLNLSQKGLVSMGRIDEIFNAKSSLVSRPEKGASLDEKAVEIKGAIIFNGLNFSYPGKKENCLHDISLEIKSGTRVALVGMIGSGKTTLVQLLSRVFDAEPGSILVDGIPVVDIPLPRLREAIGYVEQDPFLFSTSLRENITMGMPDAAEEDIRDIIRCVNLWPDIERLPEGLDTIVGERGVSLSGGQKQRVALARALIKKPKILILDDAFSSLDVETEKVIMNNVQDIIKGMTTLFVTHRFTMVREMDQIVVMDNGRVAEKGSHDDLIKREGLYHRIFKTQALAMEMEISLQ